MSTEQHRALEGTIPTTEVIKDAVTFPRDRLGEPLGISGDRFEAWLAQVRRDAAREALDQAEARVKAVRDVLDQEAPDPDVATRVRADTIRRALDGGTDGDPTRPCGRGPCCLGHGHPGDCRL